MDVRALRYAVTLSEELHFGRAAARHYVSAQGFGQQIKRLERELGFPLFARTSRTVALTPAGELFVGRARGVLASLDELGRVHEPPRRRDVLVVGTLGFGLGELWRSVRQVLQQTRPEVHLKHRALDLTTQYAVLQSGEVDVGLVFDLGPTAGLTIEPAFAAQRVAVVPVWSELASRDFLRQDDVADQAWTPVASTNDALTAWLGPAAEDAAHPGSLRHPEAIAGAVATSGALGVHAAPAATYYPHPDVRYVPLEGPGCQIAVATQTGDDRPAVKALRDAAASAVAMRELVGAGGGVDRNESR